MARRYELVFEEGWDELDYFMRAAIEFADGNQAWLLHYPAVPDQQTPVWVDAWSDFDVARRLVLDAFDLTYDAFCWVSPESHAPAGFPQVIPADWSEP